MKVLFAGPSLFGSEPDLVGIDLMPPAGFGDVEAAVNAGAVAIGLVDGYFGGQAAVWHKEILWALSLGVTVLGAASMGALRAAECAPFGMIPVGKIAAAYCDGSLDDDAAVALMHMPAEGGSTPVTEPLVDALATIDHLEAVGLISSSEASDLKGSSRTCFFAERTLHAIVGGTEFETPRAAQVELFYERNRVRQKHADAIELIGRLRSAPGERRPPLEGFAFNASPMWRQIHSSRAKA
jgi:hypothetical protein